MGRSHFRYWNLGKEFNDAWTLVSNEEEIQQIQRFISLEFVRQSDFGEVVFGVSQILFKEGIHKDHYLRKSLLEEKRDRVLDDLFNSELIAISRNKARQYQQVPAVFWDFAEPHWEFNKASDVDRYFEQIRVCKAEDAPDLASKREQGRPSLRFVLISLLEELFKADDALVLTGRHKQITRKLLSLCRTKFPAEFDRLNIADEKTFRNYVNEFRDRIKRQLDN
jgi:hypothetical protein